MRYEPAIKSDTFGADLTNALLLRPVYRAPASKPKASDKAVLREKIETKIEEFREGFPTGKLLHDTAVDGIITGLQLALDILDEEE